MATYAVRTCHKCGIKKPQPEMVHTQVGNGYNVTTNPQRKNSTRLHVKNRKVWMCKDCVGTNWGGVILFLLFIWILWAFFN